MKKKQATEEGNQKNSEKSNGNKENIFRTGENIVEADNQSAGEEVKSGNEGNSVMETTDKVIDALKAAEDKVAELQDRYVRLSAEFDNYRKRTLREKMDMVKYSDENMLVKILPLMDDFDRALLHMDTADSAALKTGIELIYGKFNEFLKQNGVKEIESANTAFNVDVHEAVAKVPVKEEDKKGKIIEVIQKGYYLQDKVIRFSKVIVGE